MADADLEIGAPSASPELTQGSPVAGVACSKWLPSSGGVTSTGDHPPLPYSRVPMESYEAAHDCVRRDGGSWVV